MPSAPVILTDMSPLFVAVAVTSLRLMIVLPRESRVFGQATAGSGNEFVDEKKIDEKQNDDGCQN